LATQNKEYRSLYQQVKSFPQIPSPEKKINTSLAAVNAFLLTGKKLIFSEPIMQDSIDAILNWYSDKHIPKEEFDASLEYGKEIAEKIINWASSDNYNETRKLRRYKISKEEGKWIPTPPGYMTAVEPYWAKIRTIALDSAGQFKPPVPPPFGKEKNSLLYKQAYEVYETVNKLSPEQKAIANFWDCNPFFLNTEGHLNYAVKKISPGGHWISIISIACKQTNAGIMKSSFAYTFTSIALFDAFIACWEEKYRSNLIRPETYIDKYIDETWRPLLQTPPFPEYNSGHSVISTAAATVLTSIFGNDFSFDDYSENEYGLPTRHYNSFMQACNEAAISRLYGGIHYRPAVENGQVQGKLIGELVIKKIHFTQ
ncbi:MAG: vanadium-dependent haloperoxidase, partial [Bacteroidetes bacterium]|nr:vanadium-dependent haloperoxidase [Bacteroidota bacterium]